jgi:hypothetical protein
VVECLPSKCEALSLNPRTTKKKKECRMDYRKERRDLSQSQREAATVTQANKPWGGKEFH